MNYFIVHYNTPELLTCLCSNINKLDKSSQIYIFENSDKTKFNCLFNNVKIFDNSENKIINFSELIETSKTYLSSNSIKANVNNFGSLKHAASIDWFLNNFEEEFILLDSDVLLKKSLTDIVDDKKILSCDFFVRDNKLLRVYPFCVYFNTPKFKELHLKFYKLEEFDANFVGTDTGGYLCKEILEKQINYKKIDLDDYIVHYGNGSWRNNRRTANLNHTEIGTYKEFLLKYKNLWE